MTQLSQNFTLAELTASDTAVRLGIDQTPTGDIVAVLARTAEQMEIVRKLLGNKPIRVNSGYRSPVLNAAIGGSRTSAHCTGYAVDFVCPDFGTPKDIAKHLSESAISFDQLIYEGTWVHISFQPTMRRQVLTAHFGKGPTTYTQGVA